MVNDSSDYLSFVYLKSFSQELELIILEKQAPVKVTKYLVKSSLFLSCYNSVLIMLIIVSIMSTPLMMLTFYYRGQNTIIKGNMLVVI